MTISVTSVTVITPPTMGAAMRRMVSDLRMRVEVESVATIREADGLAMSSRNGYLSSDERARAPVLYRALTEARDTLMSGDRDYDSIRAHAFSQLTQAGFEVDYFEIRRRLELAPARSEDERSLSLEVSILEGELGQ